MQNSRSLASMAAIRQSIRTCTRGFYFGSIVRHNTARRRFLASSKPDKFPSEASEKTQSRLERIHSRLPTFLQRYSKPLVNAPLTHISAFLLLHEVTAVVPLLGLATVFHYTRWMPPYISEGKWVSDGMEKFGKYFRKKGWLGEEGVTRRDRYWGFGEGGVRIVVE